MVDLDAGDIFFTRTSTFFGRTIRWITRAQVNHVGVVVQGGTLSQAVIVEALSFVRRIKLAEAYGSGKIPVAIYRAKGLTAEQKARVCWRAEGYVGRRYGYGKIAAHLGDWAVCKLIGRTDVYLFRRLAQMDNYPICSWVADEAYEEVGIDFGHAPDPGDIWDVVKNSTVGWICVRPLIVMGAGVESKH